MSQEYYNQGLEKLKQKNYKAAIEQFTHALQENPYFADAYRYRGLAYYESGDIYQAISDYSECLKLNPRNGEAYYCRALTRLELKNLPGSLDDIEKAINININYAAAYDLRGIVRRKQGYTTDAIANFKKAADLYLRQKDKENCRLCLEKIKQLQPKEYQTAIGQVTQESRHQQSKNQNLPIVSEDDYFTELLDKAERGDTPEALEDLNWLLLTDPQDGKAYCCRGIVRFKQGKYQEAISDFNQALGLDFRDAIVYRSRGKVRSHLGDFQGAIKDFNSAISMDPENTSVYVGRGNTYREMGNYIGAIEDYTKAIEYDSKNAHAYYNRGIAYTYIEEVQRAVDDCQRAISIFCEKEDWENYQTVLNHMKKFKSPSPEIQKTNDEVLRQRLLRLVGGHWAIAERLIEQAKHYYPGMSEEWYLETVIYDLERDKDDSN
ncbi:tetratricopeptide repeat protein [Mastigocoleus testarum]|uniref:Uncharacterized protein n=1 Tax=Mastigocoleus testarum BC008 TaxID=371196 RepID=A0A0V7ZLW6_9CYAN|nr:tetratricopeptide repeat protein [Mastigocoleus testarum]KST65578.1 hypothetical protein BC008_42420 [Mastigocoleus testarum BC008]KST66033.1 hypothetical protein BC008_23935 [Mastigocoleus testarum BC008]